MRQKGLNLPEADIQSTQEVYQMKKEMKEKILRIIVLKTKDLPRKERYLYTLAYVLFYCIQYMILLTKVI
jgi:hypothetical protein